MSQTMSKRASQRATAPAYGYPPTNAGPWWLGFNEAREGLPCLPDSPLQTARYEYLKGYEAGSAK